MTDEELLSAWLAGDLDQIEAARLERRLRAEPELAVRADAHRDLLVALRGLDDVDPPDGFQERLAARLAAERRTGAVASRSRPRWGRALTAAAASVLVIAGLGGVARWLVTDGTGGAASSGGTDSGAAVQESGVGEAAAQAGDAGTGPAVELFAEEQRVALPPLDDAAALETALLDLARGEGVTGLLGLSRADAAARAREQRLDNGGPSAPPCLDEVLGGDAALVPARVIPVTLGNTPALAYVLLAASPRSQTLDGIEVRVVDPNACRTLASATT